MNAASCAARVLDEILARPPRLGSCRLVALEGRAGSGKTTLAAELSDAAAARGLTASVVHLDDVYEGWSGLASSGRDVQRWVVEPLARGERGSFPRWDWHRGGRGEQVSVEPADLVVLEGVGSGHPGYAEHLTLLVWVQAPGDLRRQRGLARDGADLAPHWHRWGSDEGRLHAAERTRGRADLWVDGVTGAVSVRRP